jgi:hypothetical protein
MQGARNAVTEKKQFQCRLTCVAGYAGATVQIVRRGSDNEVAAQANSRSDVKPHDGRSRYRATPQTPSAAIFKTASNSSQKCI